MNLYFNGSLTTPFHMDGSIASEIDLTDTTPIKCSLGSDSKKTIDIKQTKFGDGYAQRSVNINPMTGAFTVLFRKKPSVVAFAIERFMLGRAGADWRQYQMYDRLPNEYFIWTPPYHTNPRKFICADYSMTPEDAGYLTVSCEFQEVHDPGLI